MSAELSLQRKPRSRAETALALIAGFLAGVVSAVVALALVSLLHTQRPTFEARFWGVTPTSQVE